MAINILNLVHHHSLKLTICFLLLLFHEQHQIHICIKDTSLFSLITFITSQSTDYNSHRHELNLEQSAIYKLCRYNIRCRVQNLHDTRLLALMTKFYSWPNLSVVRKYWPWIFLDVENIFTWKISDSHRNLSFSFQKPCLVKRHFSSLSV